MYVYLEHALRVYSHVRPTRVRTPKYLLFKPNMTTASLPRLTITCDIERDINLVDYPVRWRVVAWWSTRVRREDVSVKNLTRAIIVWTNQKCETSFVTCSLRYHTTHGHYGSSVSKIACGASVASCVMLYYAVDTACDENASQKRLPRGLNKTCISFLWDDDILMLVFISNAETKMFFYIE